MTVKKRLFISNLFMLLVPIAITALMALGCLGVIWYTVAHGSGLNFEDSENFYNASQGISELAEQTLQADAENPADRLSSLNDMLDLRAMSLVITSGKQMIHRYGAITQADASLLEALAVLGNEGTVSGDGRNLYAHNITANGQNYLILLFGTQGSLSYGTLKVVIVLTAIVLIATIFISILLTNRFLTKFMVQKIEEPLEILGSGVRQIRDGNLSYRIAYGQADEFAPICADFNEMAGRLKESVDSTQQHDQSRKELMAGISHDLRSPLTSIQAYVEGLLDGVAQTPEAQRSYLLTIKSKAEDIARMVGQVFLFSKMELGEYPESPQTLRLDDLIARFIDSSAAEYAARGLRFESALVPATVSADPEQLRRVLVNIAENTLKYGERDSATLRISLIETASGFRLALCDDGPGAAEEALPYLFNAFFRSDPARRDPNRGSGLGLAIAANAIRRMGGAISAQNGEAGGLAIIIDLPGSGGAPCPKS